MLYISRDSLKERVESNKTTLIIHVTVAEIVIAKLKGTQQVDGKYYIFIELMILGIKAVCMGESEDEQTANYKGAA